MSRLNHCLTGVRVLDVSSYLPGPFASLILADFGADVLKVEPPQGDAMRGLGPRGPDGTPLFHAALNAGKTIRRLDLKSPAGKAEFLALAREADVLLEGFRPGVMQRLGLDHARLQSTNPGLISCSISGYGAQGELARVAGHDGNYLALAGVLHRNGVPPRFFDPPIADMSSGLFAVIAILGALQARQLDGLGCHVDLGIADVAMPLQLFQLAALAGPETVPHPGATYLNGGAAYYNVYATRDSHHVMLGAVEPKFWRAFCDAARRPAWIDRQNDPLPQTALIGDLAAYFASLTRRDCETRFASGDCCVSPVLDLAEAVATPHHADRGLVRHADQGWQALFPARVDNKAPALRPAAVELEVTGWACVSSQA
jgi:crotonobetainyl-CoA:carnitine CoA-transferase CaiB-like acyl-CoA transferase